MVERLNGPNNNNKDIRKVTTNKIFNTSLDSTIENRYCVHCHSKLVHNPKNSPYDRYIYSCPTCNCAPVNIHSTEPSERLIATFPTNNVTSGANTNRKMIAQSTKDRLSRSEYFIQNNAQQKIEVQNNDPYLQDFLRKNNRITITSVEYQSPDNYDD